MSTLSSCKLQLGVVSDTPSLLHAFPVVLAVAGVWMGKGVVSARLSLGRDLLSHWLQGFHDSLAVFGTLCWGEG